MRLTRGLAIALWMGLPLAGIACQQPAAASGTQAAEPTPDSTNAPAHTPPVETKPTIEQKAPEDTGKETTSKGASRTTAPKVTKKRRVRTPAPVPENGPHKTVVREGGASEPAAQIVPGMTPTEALQQRQNADQLLVATDQRLKLLAGGTLGLQQQETVGQILNYMDGARSALKAGDVRRATTLAEKAHLLADDLAKH
jgi:hypothetical protein